MLKLRKSQASGFSPAIHVVVRVVLAWRGKPRDPSQNDVDDIKLEARGRSSDFDFWPCAPAVAGLPRWSQLCACCADGSCFSTGGL